jgi:sarcosine oxidase subunit alpha
VTILPGSAIVRAHGGLRVTGVDLASLEGGAARRVDCDLVCVSGGWNPAVHLY